MARIGMALRKFHRHNLTMGYYPGSVRSAVLVTSTFTGYSHYFKRNTDFCRISTLFQAFFESNSETLRVIVHTINGGILWLLLCLLRKLLLRNILLYNGWIREGKKISLKTKMFFIAVRLLNGWSIPISKNLYGCQGIMPALPVPNLRSSIQKYLASMKPLLDEKAYASMEEKARQFLRSPGPKLQLCLHLKSWLTPNYISDWWEKYVYLHNRSSLLNSNYYGQYVRDQIDRKNHKTVAEAANYVHSVLNFRKSIEENKLEPMMFQGVIPFCSWQYERIFNTCRIPGEEVDSLQHEVFSDFVVCQHRGRYFKVRVYKEGSRRALLSPAEFQVQFQRIMADESEPAEGEDRLHALTAWDRTNWAKARKEFFATGANKTSLDAIEKSAFVVHLDEKHANDKPKDLVGAYEAAGVRAYCGTVWHDKSFNFTYCENETTTNAEHSCGDGTVASRFAEIGYGNSNNFQQIDADGYICAKVETIPPYPQRLEWSLPPECIEAIGEAEKTVASTQAEFDLKVVDFTNFGKGSIKQMNTSPDAFVQMALQLAYYRDQGKFGLTYESSMTLLFLQGRTETVRSCTEDSCKWVRAMECGLNRNKQRDDFKAACTRHQSNAGESMSGEGFDRHLFGLYIAAKFLKIDSPFLTEALSSDWLLSTSQTPTIQPGKYFVGRIGGGFSPASAQGYGVSYMFCGEERIYFQLTSNKSCAKTHALTHGYYPGSLESAIIFVPLFTGYLEYSTEAIYDPLEISAYLPHLLTAKSLGLNLVTSLVLWFLSCLMRKFALRRILLYKGWMYEGKAPSVKTKMFYLAVRILSGSSKKLYYCQGILPSLPVPDLKSSVDKYLASMKSLLDKAAYASMEEKAREFLLSTGPKLQRFLHIKSWLTPNYISDWWEKYVYLHGRSSLLNSNYFAHVVQDHSGRNNHKTEAEAALILFYSLKFREAVENNEELPILERGAIPFCSWQYERLFNTCRIPGEVVDSLQHQVFSDFVVCQHRGRYFKVRVYKEGSSRVLLSPAEFQVQLQRIMADESKPAEGEDRLHALTAWDRTNWAKARKEFFATGVNKRSLEAIEKSAYVIHLDEKSDNSSSGLSLKARLESGELRASHGCFWLDKSFSIAVCGDEVAANAEHAWADGSVTAHLNEFIITKANEFKQYKYNVRQKDKTRIDENGYIIGSVEEASLPYPERLNWELPSECIKAIGEAEKTVSKSLQEFDFKILHFNDFGKGFIKKMNLSPDAFVQMALQLANYRDQGKFSLTYEPSAMLLFFQGRTETVRSCTEESCKWVRSMISGMETKQQIRYLKEACDKHQSSYRQAISGEGCDRHLFGLQVISKYLGIESPFLMEAVSFPWVLSTTQIPVFLKDCELIGRPGGAFLPVSAEGYGVSYKFCGQNWIYFQVSSNRTHLGTGSAGFAGQIQSALRDMQKLLLSGSFDALK